MTSLAAALVEAQKKMPVVHKTARADTGSFSYSYATLDLIIEKTRPVLNEHGLAISQFPAELDHGGPGLKTVLLHAESGETIEATLPLLLNGKNDMQTLGGAITYARRYGWAAVLGIANDEDDDGTAASAPGTGASQASASTEGGAADRAAVTAQTPTTEPPAAPTSDDGWTWPFGKNKGKSLAETDDGYLDWFLENSDKEDIKERVRAFREGFADFQGSDSDIPFDRTIDGLGN